MSASDDYNDRQKEPLTKLERKLVEAAAKGEPLDLEGQSVSAALVAALATGKPYKNMDKPVSIPGPELTIRDGVLEGPLTLNRATVNVDLAFKDISIPSGVTAYNTQFKKLTFASRRRGLGSESVAYNHFLENIDLTESNVIELSLIRIRVMGDSIFDKIHINGSLVGKGSYFKGVFQAKGSTIEQDLNLDRAIFDFGCNINDSTINGAFSAQGKGTTFNISDRSSNDPYDSALIAIRSYIRGDVILNETHFNGSCIFAGSFIGGNFDASHERTNLYNATGNALCLFGVHIKGNLLLNYTNIIGRCDFRKAHINGTLDLSCSRMICEQLYTAKDRPTFSKNDQTLIRMGIIKLLNYKNLIGADKWYRSAYPDDPIQNFSIKKNNIQSEMFSNAFTELGVEAELIRGIITSDKKLVKSIFSRKNFKLKWEQRIKRRRMHALDMSDANIEHLIMPLGPENRPRGTVHLSRARVNVFEDFSDGWPDPLPNRNKPNKPKTFLEFRAGRYLALSLDASRIATASKHEGVLPDPQTGSRVYSADQNRAVRVWDVTTGEQVIDKPLLHDDAVNLATFSHDGKRLATACKNGAVSVWDVTTGEPAIDKALLHDDIVNFAVFSSCGKELVTGCKNGAVHVWDLETSEQVKLWHLPEDPSDSPLKRPLQNEGRNSVVSSFDGARLATLSADGAVHLWEPQTGRQVTKEPLQHSGDDVCVIAFSPSGKRLVTASKNGMVNVWGSKTGDQITDGPLLHGNAVKLTAFCLDDTLLVTACNSGAVRVWNLATFDFEANDQAPVSFQHNEAVTFATFSTDGARLITICESGAVRVWNAETGELITEEPFKHDVALYIAAIAPCGTRLVSADKYGIVRLWSINGDASCGLHLDGFKYEYLQNPNGEPRQLDCSKYISKYIIESLRSKAISLGSLLYQTFSRLSSAPINTITALHNDNLKQLQTAWRLKYRPPSDYPKTPPKDVAKAREFWLLGQSEDALVTHFQPQPWRQLALTLQRQGYDREARRTSIQRRIWARKAESTPFFSTCISWLLHVFADYGFNPWKTVIWSAGFVGFYGGLLWWTSGNHPMPGDAIRDVFRAETAYESVLEAGDTDAAGVPAAAIPVVQNAPSAIETDDSDDAVEPHEAGQEAGDGGNARSKDRTSEASDGNIVDATQGNTAEEAPPTDSVIRPDDTAQPLEPAASTPGHALADSDATQEITLFVRVRADDFIAAYLDPQAAEEKLNRTYPDFSPFLYAFDVFVPLLDFGSETYWRANDQHPVGRWLHFLSVLMEIIGAIMVALIITGFTGLLSREDTDDTR